MRASMDDIITSILLSTDSMSFPLALASTPLTRGSPFPRRPDTITKRTYRDHVQPQRGEEEPREEEINPGVTWKLLELTKSRIDRG